MAIIQNTLCVEHGKPSKGSRDAELFIIQSDSAVKHINYHLSTLGDVCTVQLYYIGKYYSIRSDFVRSDNRD